MQHVTISNFTLSDYHTNFLLPITGMKLHVGSKHTGEEYVKRRAECATCGKGPYLYDFYSEW